MPKKVSGPAGKAIGYAYASTSTATTSTEEDYLNYDVMQIQQEELNDKKKGSKTGIPADHEVRVKALVEMYEQFAKNIKTKPEEGVGIGTKGKKTKPTIPSTKIVSRLSADIPNTTWFDSDDGVKFRLYFLESKVTSAVTFFNELIAIKINNARNNFVHAMESEKRLKEQKAKAKQHDKMLMRFYSKLTRLEIAALKLQRECLKLLEIVPKLEKSLKSKTNRQAKKVGKMMDDVSLLSSLVDQMLDKTGSIVDKLPAISLKMEALIKRKHSEEAMMKEEGDIQ